MPTLETLTEANLNEVMRPKSISRAYGYLNRVQNATRTGSTLSAQVGRNYQVEIQVEPGGILAQCSCPYNWGGYCKHIGAVLLTWIQSPGTFAVKEPPTKMDDFPLPATPVDPPPTTRPPQLPIWLTADLAERQQMDQKRLNTWLQQLKVQELRALAKKRGWKVKGTKKDDIVQQLIEPMTDPAEILRAIHTLDAEHQQVLRAMMVAGGAAKITVEDLTRITETWGQLTGHKKISTYTGHLCELGLAVPGEIEYVYPPRPDFIPRAIARHLPPGLSEVLPTPAETSPDSSAVELRLADPLALVRAAHQVILMLEQQAVPLRPPLPRPDLVKFFPHLADWDYDPHELLAAQQKGKLQPYGNTTLAVPPPAYALPDETITRLALLVNGEARLEFIYALLVAAGVFQPGSPVTVWPEVKEQFLRRAEPAQRAVLARTYFAMINWSELWEVLRAEPKLQLRRLLTYSYLKPEQLRAELTYFRQLVLGVLACLPDDQWIELDGLIPLMRRVWSRFDQKMWQEAYYYYTQDTGSWFLARTQNGQPLSTDNDSDWILGQWNFIRRMITEPLHWLGLADLSVKNGVVVALRLHGLGDLFWDRVETPDAPAYAVSQTTAVPPAEAVSIEGLTVAVNPATITTQAHTFLDKIARLDEVTPQKFTYTLDVHSVQQTFEAGETLENLLADWDRLLPVPLPQHIRDQFNAWWQGYGQVRLYQNVTVIEFDDDYALAEMKAVTSLADHLIAEISPRLVLVAETAVDSLTAELEKAGYTPKQTEQV